MQKAFSDKCCAYGLWGVLLLLVFSGPAYAAAADDVAENIVESSDRLPGLIAAFSYMLGLLLGVTGIFKLKEHVDNPNQAPLRVAIIRFIIGGALFALPSIYGAMYFTLNGGGANTFDPGSSGIGGMLSGLIGKISSILPTFDVNSVLVKIAEGLERLPGIILATAYILALILGVVALIKIKEHVENPEQTPMREGVVRLLIAGALFAISAMYDAMFNSVGGGGLVTGLTSIFGTSGMIYSSYGKSACDPSGGFLGTLTGILGALGGIGSAIGGALGIGPSGASTLGDAMCNVVTRAGAFPAFLTGLGYLIGLVVGFAGILKIKAHVLDPSRTSIWEGVSRLLAAGAFFALPAITQVVRNTLTPLTLDVLSLKPTTSYNDPTSATSCDGSGTGGLDHAMYCMMDNVFSPMHILLNFFTFCAGTILVMIGISRLIRTTQEGPKAPGGFGTLMTFAMGGALISYNSLLRAATGTIFGNPVTLTFAKLGYMDGMDADEVNHAEVVVASIIKFMILIGLVSFIRGIFIVRDVAEGNQQASLMAGVTHMVGGALAVNLGPLINAVETTLGIGAFGIAFS